GWLLLGVNAVGSWATCFVAFACFAAVTFRLAVVGQASCGCLGNLHVAPLGALILDLAVLAALGVATVVPLYGCPSDPRVTQVLIAQREQIPVAFTSYLGVSGKNLFVRDGVL